MRMPSTTQSRAALASLLAMLVFACPAHEATASSRTAVARASCGPQDRTETVQGQTTLAERHISGPARTYQCNLELVGQFEGEGAGADMEAFGRCVYYTTGVVGISPKGRNPGVAVIDATDLSRPKISTYLTSPAMLVAHESLEVSTSRKLLLASTPPSTFDIYDLSVDCLRPTLKSSTSLSTEFSGLYSHAGQFASDGRTYYGATWPPDLTKERSIVFALDTSDSGNPTVAATWVPTNKHWRTHVVSVNRESTRAYVGLQRMEEDHQRAPHPNGVVVLDIRDVQARTPNAKFRVISSLFWDDAHMSSLLTPFRSNGRSYLLASDAAGAIGMYLPPPNNACDSGRPGNGFSRIIDITDERAPKTVSKLMLEVSEPANCSKVMHDPTIVGGYGAFGCSVDNDTNAKLLACGQHEAGLRVFDIRDPTRPREVAYYKPPARRTEARMGSLWRTALGNKDYTADSIVVVPLFRNNAKEIWFTSTDNGFQAVRFTEQFMRQHPELFQN